MGSIERQLDDAQQDLRGAGAQGHERQIRDLADADPVCLAARRHGRCCAGGLPKVRVVGVLGVLSSLLCFHPRK